ncbi:WD40 repeat-like protein [Lepidopterella palustris CBS 459.81]|uniref:WD40 repeat-like protein n=1 Tax=Lepidopterella palustris CBS 459.81 TaxID=1314670 RepID=A0A8E2JHY9_9PEZI|nr:WD40 repeat-like protein [Lepidopterella palustris CBS 459.81]
MAPQKSQKGPRKLRQHSQKAQNNQQPEPEIERSGSEDESGSDSEGLENGNVEMEKDDTEEELEKLVFGDSVGFREGIKSFRMETEGIDEENEEEQEEATLEDVADADLFFLDSGPSGPTQALMPALTSDDEDDDADMRRNPPAWEDSEDERMTVSLASVPRLRKLRRTEDEDLINGKEYARRLRKQFERLYPAPEWANPPASKSTKKKRRRSSDAMSSSEDEDYSADDMDVDDDHLSAQPLAKLLKDVDALTRRTNSGPNKRRKLQPEVIDIQRMKDISGALPSAITSLSFHPTLPLILSSGPSSTLYLHHIYPHPPNPNPLVTSLHIKNTPLTTTAFHPSPSDSRIFLSARRRYFHIWNLTTGSIEKITRVYGHQHEQRSMEHFSLSPNGKYMALKGTARKGGGVVNFLDAYTLQWVGQARVESRGGIADFAWWNDGKGITIAGKNGEITEWDVERQQMMARWIDEGAVGTTVIALGGRSGREGWLGGDRWVAVGSSSGIVNIYDRRAWSAKLAKALLNGGDEDSNSGVPKTPTPVRALDHLTTAISHLAFSPDGQLLAMASRSKKNAMRLVHLPSCTVYRNWPTDKTPLGRISALAWGDGQREEAEAFLAVANEQGKIRLWEVRA